MSFFGGDAPNEHRGIVRSDIKGQELSAILLKKLIDYCRRRGTKELVGEALNVISNYGPGSSMPLGAVGETLICVNGPDWRVHYRCHERVGTIPSGVSHSQGAPMQAIRIIGNEHRSLAAVLHGMLYLVHHIRDHDTKPNFAVLGAMVYYIDTVPERFHHPKEDKYLFTLLRSRCPAAHPLLDRLEQEHCIGAEKIRTVEQALSRYQHGGRAEFPAFLAVVDDYVAFEWEHMRLEETEVLPLAKEHLTVADWESIDAAFAGHTDPLLGAEAGAKYDQLFTRIVNLAPAPIGLG